MDNHINDKVNEEVPKKSISIKTRLLTALICVPILIILLCFRFTSLILIIAVIYVAYLEFNSISISIMSALFEDYLSDIIWQTLIKSYINPLALITCPLLFYFTVSAEFWCLFVLFLIILFLCFFRFLYVCLLDLN